MGEDADSDRPADRDFIATCYEVFLGREIESLEVIRDRAGWPRSKVIRSIVQSAEFVDEVLPALETGYPFLGDRFRGKPSLRQRLWAADQLPTSSTLPQRLLSLENWREILTCLLEDSLISAK